MKRSFLALNATEETGFALGLKRNQSAQELLAELTRQRVKDVAPRRSVPIQAAMEFYLRPHSSQLKCTDDFGNVCERCRAQGIECTRSRPLTGPASPDLLDNESQRARLGQLPEGKELEEIVQLFFSSVHRSALQSPPKLLPEQMRGPMQLLVLFFRVFMKDLELYNSWLVSDWFNKALFTDED
ncbi:unnamed protein product [Penicillium manginii]